MRTTVAVRSSLLSASVALLAATLAAQQPPEWDFRAPLHTAADDPAGGAYGLWASGNDFKASFHDGFAFYPVRGPDRELVQLHWRTESIRVGGVECVVAQPEAKTAEWRHELDHGAVTERYEVRPDGVEQSFVLERPVGPGDVAVTGRVLGGLRAPVVGPKQQAIRFSDGGGVVVRYGEALAFDAAGNRAPVTTSWDGERIELVLDGAFLAKAQYPVTIDPLLSTVTINSNSLAPVHHTAIAADNNYYPGVGATGKVWAMASRTFASGDDDAYGLLCNKDFSAAQMVFADLSTSWSTPFADVAHVDQSDRWVVALQRDFSSTNRQLRVYFHDQASTTLNGGAIVWLSAPGGTRWQKPKVAGRRHSNSDAALLVFEEESNTINGPWQEPHYALINAGSRTVSAAQAVHAGANAGNDWVSCTVRSPAWSHHPFIIAVLAHQVVNGNYYHAEITYVDMNGTRRSTTGISNLGAGAVGDLAVSGTPWRLMVAWTRADNGRRLLEVRRMDDGPTNPSQPTLGPVRTVGGSLVQVFRDLDLDYDYVTASHWALTYTKSVIGGTRSAYVVRLGHTGGTTESATLVGNTLVDAIEPVVCFAETTTEPRFLIAMGTSSSINRRLVGREFIYPTTALMMPYGTACNPTARLITAGRPYAGDEYFHLGVGQVLRGDLAILLVGLSPTGMPLGQFGFPPGCNLYVDPNGALSFVAVQSSQLNLVGFPLPLPDAPLFVGDLYAQGAVLPSNGTPFVTHGLGIQVR